MNQMGPLKYISIFIDDLWMYFYDKRYYNNTMLYILKTVNQIENTKWTLLNFAAKAPLSRTQLPYTDYTAYSNSKHLEIDGVDDSFARSSFEFLLLSVPQTILLCFILKKIFNCFF